MYLEFVQQFSSAGWREGGKEQANINYILLSVLYVFLFVFFQNVYHVSGCVLSVKILRASEFRVVTGQEIGVHDTMNGCMVSSLYIQVRLISCRELRAGVALASLFSPSSCR
jgi:hypothetical protein